MNVRSDDPTDRALLVRVTGPDRPGITTDLMDVLDLSGVSVQDLEQVLVRGHLTLAAVVDIGPDAPPDQLNADLQLFADRHGLIAEVSPVPAASTEHRRVDAVVVLGHELETALSPTELGDVAGAIAAAGGNIDRIVRLARYPIYAYEFRVTGADPFSLRQHVAEAAAAHRLDTAIQAEGLGRRAKRLVMMDVDSTL
ncbi:MAG: ACT domain-containing protein, partial [Actinomycetes bacterium]